jgi:hypothetical protein
MQWDGDRRTLNLVILFSFGGYEESVESCKGESLFKQSLFHQLALSFLLIAALLI